MMKNLKMSCKSLVSSRKFTGGQAGFIKGWMVLCYDKFARSAHNELTSNYSRLTTKRVAFTMAEILLSLTIIGVVAAITLPSLTGNINERTWNTQRKALHARFSQAIALMPALNGYGTISGTISAEDGTQTIAEDNAAETFVSSGLSKVLKINNICDSTHLGDCGLPAKIIPISGSSFDFPKDMQELSPAMVRVRSTHWDGTPINYDILNTKAAALETANGESIAVFYNPRCVANMNENHEYMMQTKICAHFIFDLNGKKGPNTVNKDIGIMTAIYPTDSVVAAPYVNAHDAASGETFEFDEMQAQCNLQDPEYRVPNQYELMSLFISRRLIGNLGNGYRASNINVNRINTGNAGHHAWRFDMVTGNVMDTRKTDRWPVRCVRR